MYGNHSWFLHMDDDWMHRVYLANASGQIIGRSKSAYFRLEDAQRALAMMMYSVRAHPCMIEQLLQLRNCLLDKPLLP